MGRAILSRCHGKPLLQKFESYEGGKSGSTAMSRSVVICGGVVLPVTLVLVGRGRREGRDGCEPQRDEDSHHTFIVFNLSLLALYCPYPSFAMLSVREFVMYIFSVLH